MFLLDPGVLYVHRFEWFRRANDTICSVSFSKTLYSVAGDCIVDESREQDLNRWVDTFHQY